MTLLLAAPPVGSWPVMERLRGWLARAELALVLIAAAAVYFHRHLKREAADGPAVRS
jgi:cytidylate kinase